MLDVMAAELRAERHEVTVIDVCGLAVRPCIGCMSCRSSGRCVLPADDAQRYGDSGRKDG